MKKDDRDVLVLGLLLWLLWPRAKTTVTTAPCWIHPETGECIPVEMAPAADRPALPPAPGADSNSVRPSLVLDPFGNPTIDAGGGGGGSPDWSPDWATDFWRET